MKSYSKNIRDTQKISTVCQAHLSWEIQLFKLQETRTFFIYSIIDCRFWEAQFLDEDHRDR